MLRARRGNKGGLNPPNARLATLDEVVLPNSDDAPASLTQRAVDTAVAGLVGGHLLLPEGAVVGRELGVLRTGVPEAAVHEEREPLLPEHKIGFSEHGLPTAPAGDAVPAEVLHQGEFGVLVAMPTDAGHDLGSFRLGEDVRHFLQGSPVHRHDFSIHHDYMEFRRSLVLFILFY